MKKVNILIVLFSFVFFNCQKRSILKDDIKTSTIQYHIDGRWMINCENSFQQETNNEEVILKKCE